MSSYRRTEDRHRCRRHRSPSSDRSGGRTSYFLYFLQSPLTACCLLLASHEQPSEGRTASKGHSCDSHQGGQLAVLVVDSSRQCGQLLQSCRISPGEHPRPPASRARRRELQRAPCCSCLAGGGLTRDLTVRVQQLHSTEQLQRSTEPRLHSTNSGEWRAGRGSCRRCCC
jgi:hypothetical protein